MLCLSLKQDEPLLIEHEGKEMWIALRIDQGVIRATISGPKSMQVSRPRKHGFKKSAPAGFERLFYGSGKGRN